MIITDTGTIIRIHADEISKIGRDTKGVIVMRTDDGAQVATISIAPREDDELPEGLEVEEASEGENLEGVGEEAPVQTEE